MEKVRPWCGQPSDRGRLRNRTINTKCSRGAGARDQWTRLVTGSTRWDHFRPVQFSSTIVWSTSSTVDECCWQRDRLAVAKFPKSGVWDKVPGGVAFFLELSAFPHQTVNRSMEASMPKTSSIRSAVSTEPRLVHVLWTSLVLLTYLIKNPSREERLILVDIGWHASLCKYAIVAHFAYCRIFRILQQSAHIAYFSRINCHFRRQF